jgi:glycosyltransferase involved in cell wall biosynthesis
MTGRVLTDALDENPRRRSALRVAVSGLFLEEPHTGTGRYTRHVVEFLTHVDDFDTRVLVDDRTTAQAYWKASDGPPRKVVTAPLPPLRPRSYERKLAWEQIALPAAALRLGAQVLYSPHFSVPLVSPCPTVVSVHDVIPLTDPAYARTLTAKAYFRLVGAAARRSSAVITLSNFAKAEIVRLLGIEASRIHVVSPGIESSFDSAPNPASSARSRERYALPEQYLLYLGGADARKNIGVLLQAVASIDDACMLPTLVPGLARQG